MPKLTKILGAATLVLTLAGAAQAEGLKADQVVATVNGKDITLGQMLVVHDSLPAEYLSLPDDVLFNGILEQLIQQTALSEIGEGMRSAPSIMSISPRRSAASRSSWRPPTISKGKPGWRARKRSIAAGSRPERDGGSAPTVIRPTSRPDSAARSDSA